MEQPSFELTPTQKGLLTSLSRETGKPIPALLDAALEALQEREHLHPETPTSEPSPRRKKRLGEIAEELFCDIPEEDLARIPVDGADRHDYYIRHGWPKSPR